MRFVLRRKKTGFYLLLAAVLLAIVSFIYYLTWSQTQYNTNYVVLTGIAAGFVLNVLVLLLNSDYLFVLTTISYSVALFQLLSDSAGSFADAYQGIVMFGDPTQVSTILTICALLGVNILFVIISGFTGARDIE